MVEKPGVPDEGQTPADDENQDDLPGGGDGLGAQKDTSGKPGKGSKKWGDFDNPDKMYEEFQSTKKQHGELEKKLGEQGSELGALRSELESLRLERQQRELEAQRSRPGKKEYSTEEMRELRYSNPDEYDRIREEQLEQKLVQRLEQKQAVERAKAGLDEMRTKYKDFDTILPKIQARFNKPLAWEDYYRLETYDKMKDSLRSEITKELEENATRIRKGSFESGKGGKPPSGGARTLTPEQMRVARKFKMTPEEYSAELDKMNPQEAL